MAVMAIRDNLNILGKASGEITRRTLRRIAGNPVGGLFAGGDDVDRLLLAPQDLRVSDPIAARDIYSGRVFLAGQMVDCAGSDPFTKKGTPIPWQRELHNFQWLCHLEASQNAVAKNNAQALIGDWLNAFGKIRNNIAWSGEVAGRRLISWISHSPTVVEGATPAFYRAWLRSVGAHIRFLRRKVNESPPGLPRLIVRIALAYAVVCVSGQQGKIEKTIANLDEELKLQINEDGGHITRNPSALVEILILLLPLRESLIRLGISPTTQMISAIDRMMVALKFYQLGDGNLARFNGVSVCRPELLSAILCHSENFGPSPESAMHSGYQRMELGDTILLADTGRPPPAELSLSANAGTLSFELSSGTKLLIVNCGAPAMSSEKFDMLARLTAAHSTASINDTSLARIYSGNRLQNLLANQLISGPGKVLCERRDEANHKQFSASHDGYLKKFGILHQRSIRLSENGNRVDALDRFTANSGKPLQNWRAARFDIRFHLHPSVSAGKTHDGSGILLMAGRGQIWKFTCSAVAPEIEDSIYLASTSGPKRSKQIVLSGDTGNLSELSWQLVRQSSAATE